jgi:hypothetical protein
MIPIYDLNLVNFRYSRSSGHGATLDAARGVRDSILESVTFKNEFAQKECSLAKSENMKRYTKVATT